MDVWNRGRHIIYCDKRRSDLMESKLNIISSDVIFLAGCTADPQASNEATVHMLLVRAAHHYTESHHSSASYCIHQVSHSYPRRTRFTSPSRSCFLIPTCWGITQALLPPILAHHSRDLLHWATQESEAATRPTMTCNNAIAKHTAMSPSGHADDYLGVDLALSLAPAQDNMHAMLYPLLRECHSHVARCRWRGVG